MSLRNDDWRLQGQERYLSGATLHWRRYRRPRADWDHDHCEFCGAAFAELDQQGFLREGYTTEDQYRWVCLKCARDVAPAFKFTLVGGPPSI